MWVFTTSGKYIEVLHFVSHTGAYSTEIISDFRGFPFLEAVITYMFDTNALSELNCLMPLLPKSEQRHFLRKLQTFFSKSMENSIA